MHVLIDSNLYREEGGKEGGGVALAHSSRGSRSGQGEAPSE
jgi:hypothetical protein